VATYPLLVGLAAYALRRNLEVEVHTSLYPVTPAVWDLFRRPRVRVVTSYYSPDAAVHERIIGPPRQLRPHPGESRQPGRQRDHPRSSAECVCGREPVWPYVRPIGCGQRR
jgi:hypothetical protein